MTEGIVTGAAAVLKYTDTISRNGWGVVKLETNKNVPDEVQAMAAG